MPQRAKCKELIRPGVLVLCREDGLPPLKWRIGRVIQVHPGINNTLRAVIIKTSIGDYKRPLAILCVLPSK